MKKVNLDNYRTDKFYPRIVRAVEALLSKGDVVAPIEVFVEMKLLTSEAVEDWRRGRVSCLERVIQCNLSAASRILRILRMHVHDLDLRPSITVYWSLGQGTEDAAAVFEIGRAGKVRRAAPPEAAAVERTVDAP